MKRTKIYGLLLTAILSGNVFASEPFDVKFTSTDLENDPTFNCIVNGEDTGTLLNPTLVTITSSDNINVIGANDNNGKAITNVKAEKLSDIYFTVTQGNDSDSDGHLFVNTNNETRVTCTRGTADRKEFTAS